MRCPGSVAATRNLIDKGSEHAALGTAAHELAAFLLQGKGLQAIDLLGAMFNGHSVDEEMARHVQAYVDYVSDLPGTHWVEQEVPIEPWTGEPGGKGTADHLALDRDLLQVTDLKYGIGVPVQAKDNEQLMLYALGAYEQFSHLFDINLLRLAIVQPRLNSISTWEISTGDLLTFGEQVKVAARYASEPDAPRIPGDKQCRWCLAKGACPAQRQAIEQAVARQGSDYAADLALVQLAREWVNAVEERATTAMLGGASVEGWKLVESRTQRTWRHEGLALRALRKLGLKLDECKPRSLKSVAQIEKALTREQMDQLANVINKPRGRPVLAREEDRRPPVDLAELAGFDIIPD